jgi:carboxyl-terminal processing protease
MKNMLKRNIILVLVCGILFTNIGSISYGAAVETKAGAVEVDIEAEMIFMEKMIEFIDANYYKDVDEREMIDGALKGLFFSLDKHSNYYTKEEFEQLSEDLSGDFGGIGVNITSNAGYITVITPLKGTPGYKAGILPGDIIISVDGEDIEGITTRDASKLIRGEVGTDVRLGILREGTQGALYIDVKREIIEINPIDYEILEDNIGYIRIGEFNNHTYDNIINALYEMDKNKVKDIVFDVRNNPGGSLNEVVRTLRRLVPKGPIVHIKHSDGKLETYKSYNVTPEYNIAVLTNKGSASASEIFAAAIKESGAGTVIGTNTYGKSTVQTLIPLINGGGVKITTAEYLTANKNSVNEIGVEPDIKVEDNMEKDLHLEKAIEILKK